MSVTDYNPQEDGDKLVRASAMHAALQAYHARYLADKNAVMHYRGSVATYDDLEGLEDDPTVTLLEGDIYNVIESGANYGWTGQAWDNFGSGVDLSAYATKTYVDDKFNTNVNIGGTVTAAGEVTAVQTVEEDGQTSTVNHRLTEKLDVDDYHAGYTWGEAANKFTWGTVRGDHSSDHATSTTNLSLTKPGLGDPLSVAVLNANFDLLDAAAKLRVIAGSGSAVSVDQLQLLDNASSIWKGLDEVRLYNGTDALYCKAGVTTGLLLQDNQVKIVGVIWNNGVPAVGTTKGYVDANGDYHSANTSLETLRESVSQNTSDISTLDIKVAKKMSTADQVENAYIGIWDVANNQWTLNTKIQNKDIRHIIVKDNAIIYGDASWNTLWQLINPNITTYDPCSVTFKAPGGKMIRLSMDSSSAIMYADISTDGTNWHGTRKILDYRLPASSNSAVSAASGVRIDNQTIYRNGPVRALRLSITATSAKSGDWTVGQLASSVDYPGIAQAHGIVCGTNNWFYAYSNGTIGFSGTLSANASAICYIEYPVAV